MFDITQHSRGNNAERTSDILLGLGPAASNTWPVQDTVLPSANCISRRCASHIHYDRGPTANLAASN
jgi:hypothetical protein